MPNVPTIQTERLILRELIETDAPSYEKYFADYEVIRHLTNSVPWPYPEGGALSFIQSGVMPQQGISKWVWAITLKDDPDNLIGAVELLAIASPSNRGFWLGQPFWGKGYMTEAVFSINNYAFEHLGFERLIFANAVSNKRSARIKEKTGARFIGVEPVQYVDPLLTQRELYELTKEEWLKLKQGITHE